jgi:protein-disulfide isomerase
MYAEENQVCSSVCTSQDEYLAFPFFLMKARLFFPSALLAGTVLLSACGVDTTGLSASTSRGPNPKTSANAGVTVTEFGDLQCPACRSAQTLIVKPLIDKYGSQIKFDQYTMLDAEASECAADQGKFWEYEDLAYTKQPDLNSAAPVKWAKELGLDMTLFNRCTKSHIKKKEILADYQEGQKLGVNGTPTFFINGKKVETNLASMSATIDAAIQGQGQRL